MQNAQSTRRSSARPPAEPQLSLGASQGPSPIPSSPSSPSAPVALSPVTGKQITLRTLSALKQRLYARASVATQQQPSKAEAIQKRVNSDAAHIAFVINLVSIKL